MFKGLKYKIKDFAVTKGLTYEEISNVCRVDRQTVNNWANRKIGDKAEIPYQSLRALAELFDLESIDQLFNSEELIEV